VSASNGVLPMRRPLDLRAVALVLLLCGIWGVQLRTPLFGVLFGALLLREPIESRFAIGSLLVLAGISNVNSQLARKPNQ
jgi:drug/metabolite transporter (DMT)-like permease